MVLPLQDRGYSMIQITEINDDPKQILYLVINGYDKAKLTLEFKPNQYSWFYSLEWQNFSTFNEKISNSPNILRQYRKILPFGILIGTDGGQDPMSIDAFTTTSGLYLLDSSEVLQVESSVYDN